MKKTIKTVLLGTAALSSLAMLSACSNQSQSGHVKLPSSYSASGKASRKANNGTLNVAEVNDSPFTGISSPSLISNAEDADVFSPGGNNALFNNDKNYKINDSGLASLKLDRKANTATVTLRKNAKWSNKMPVTAKDIEYPYEVVGNKASTSQLFSDNMMTLKGMKEYHAGKAKSIAGITFPEGENGKKAVLHFDRVTPAMQYNGNDYMTPNVEPYEYEKNVPITKLASSPQVRKNPIFTGPYKVDKIVQGESTNWSPNPYYYGRKPNIKHISIQVVGTSSATAAFKAKKFDFNLSSKMPTTQFPALKNLSDYAEVGQPAAAFNYFGFNVGHFDTKTGKNVMDKNAKMSNPNLRKAMMYAINLDEVNKKFGNGLTWRANSLVPPAFKEYYDASLPGFSYNIKKANQLLDKAGYKKKGKWRTQPNGKPLEINFAAKQGSDSDNATHNYELQQWRKVGLNVNYTTGRPMEMNSMYSTLEKPKQNQIDVWNGGFTVNPDPSPSAIWGVGNPYNMGHFATKENTDLLNSMNSEKAWDNNYRIKQFKKWQKYMNDECFVGPDSFQMNWSPVNKRIKGYNIDGTTNGDLGPNFWTNLSLTK